MLSVRHRFRFGVFCVDTCSQLIVVHIAKSKKINLACELGCKLPEGDRNLKALGHPAFCGSRSKMSATVLAEMLEKMRVRCGSLFVAVSHVRRAGSAHEPRNKLCTTIECVIGWHRETDDARTVLSKKLSGFSGSAIARSAVKHFV